MGFVLDIIPVCYQVLRKVFKKINFVPTKGLLEKESYSIKLHPEKIGSNTCKLILPLRKNNDI